MIEENKKISCCVYSSFIFFINAGLAYLYELYLYSFLFFSLAITSIIVHATNDTIIKVIDKIFVYSIVFYGGYLFFNKLQTFTGDMKQIIFSFFIITTFLSTIYLYYYGYCYNQYCYCDDITVANLYHSLLHVISSIGHILITIL
jgi:hypothetical protein